MAKSDTWPALLSKTDFSELEKWKGFTTRAPCWIGSKIAGAALAEGNQVVAVLAAGHKFGRKP